MSMTPDFDSVIREITILQKKVTNSEAEIGELKREFQALKKMPPVVETADSLKVFVNSFTTQMDAIIVANNQKVTRLYLFGMKTYWNFKSKSYFYANCQSFGSLYDLSSQLIR